MRAFAAVLMFVVMLNGSQMSEIDRKIVQIQSATPVPLPTFKNPFVYQRVVAPIRYISKKEVNLKLAAVVANSAQISNGWYKVGDMVSGWAVDAIFLNFVVLKRGEQELRLYINEKKYDSSNIVKASGQ